ncbi:unnamed protein product (macronuclear) [Paramecium tetraurelia]|uniref:RING-type domain-containing protein n=1 Tax=Paramecium tetraurelia TaxID=5888 RepID=A0DA94_PARTE|nr:uncharacterized protein GSPATT00014868001 [Paramecium tetraurelia]CAK79961.1 unnamed protein product [Paramecium tetraurelia]|eukprot:XP_001447358.1 hypothetical protein (macronuclear) [Paramecium tetraurelia strain d4-2]
MTEKKTTGDYNRLQNRNNQFKKCSDCLNNTISKNPIANIFLKMEQALCSSCINTNLYVVPKTQEFSGAETFPFTIYRKILCKLHKHEQRLKCKECSIYLNEKNYAKCPFCEFSIFKRNLKKWSILYPIHKCEVCNHYQCLKCQSVPGIMGNDAIECYTCSERKQDQYFHVKHTIKQMNTFQGIQFLITILCVAIFTPIQIMGKTTSITKQIIDWQPLSQVTPRQYLFKLTYTVIVGPFLWLWIYLRYFFILFWESYSDNVRLLYRQMIPQP